MLGLWRSKKIPERGSVIDHTTYEPHGIGCRAYLSGICIDFDCGPDGRVRRLRPLAAVHIRVRTAAQIQKIHQ
ncbi:DUF6896 domain-containing protein [Pseudomonas tritici]|uniref:DUF6896 domain-containing protein n=1 Tax=Pseudomonas tritici TaxID=2745518 RepID=UPI00387AA714